MGGAGELRAGGAKGMGGRCSVVKNLGGAAIVSGNGWSDGRKEGRKPV